MGKCKDCKDYEPLPLPETEIEKRQGKCEWMNKLSGVEDNGVFGEYGDEDLWVGENFGCIHFERREKSSG